MTTDPGLEPTGSLPTESRVFGGMGLFAALIAVIYGIFSGPEWAGLAALTASAVFGLAMAIFFARRLGAVQADVAEAEAVDAPDGAAAGVMADPGPDSLYLPEASIWPFFIGLGAALTFTGLAYGVWFIVPGVALLLHSVVGFALQSRRRAVD